MEARHTDITPTQTSSEVIVQSARPGRGCSSIIESRRGENVLLCFAVSQPEIMRWAVVCRASELCCSTHTEPKGGD